MRSLRPGEDWGSAERLDGENGLGLGDGTGVFQDLADLDELAEQLSQSYGGARMDDLDLDKLARQLGDDARVDARTLQRLAVHEPPHIFVETSELAFYVEKGPRVRDCGIDLEPVADYAGVVH